jgi:hypothetical protein
MVTCPLGDHIGRPDAFCGDQARPPSADASLGLHVPHDALVQEPVRLGQRHLRHQR